jgi:hypothetical protein
MVLRSLRNGAAISNVSKAPIEGVPLEPHVHAGCDYFVRRYGINATARNATGQAHASREESQSRSGTDATRVNTTLAK